MAQNAKIGIYFL